MLVNRAVVTAAQGWGRTLGPQGSGGCGQGREPRGRGSNTHEPHFSGGFLLALPFWTELPSVERQTPLEPGRPGRPLQGTRAFWQALGLASPPQLAGEARAPAAEPGTLGAGRTDNPRPWTSEDPARAGLSAGVHGQACVYGTCRHAGAWPLASAALCLGTDRTTACCSAEVGAGRERGLPFSAFGRTPNSREEVRLRGLALEEKLLKQLRPSPCPAPRAPLGNVSPAGGWPLSSGFWGCRWRLRALHVPRRGRPGGCRLGRGGVSGAAPTREAELRGWDTGSVWASGKLATAVCAPWASRGLAFSLWVAGLRCSANPAGEQFPPPLGGEGAF